MVKAELAALASENKRYINEYLSVINGIFTTITDSENREQYTNAGMVLKDKAEAAYYRKSQFPKRVKLMDSWAAYCDTIPADADNVTPIRKGKAS